MEDRRDRRRPKVARALLLLGLALGAVGLPPVGGRTASGQPAAQAPAKTRLRFSRHAQQRLKERGVSRADVERLVAEAKPFPYQHEGRGESGYYDPRTGLFAAVAEDGTVITVIAHATPRYVEKLKRSARSP